MRPSRLHSDRGRPDVRSYFFLLFSRPSVGRVGAVGAGVWHEETTSFRHPSARDGLSRFDAQLLHEGGGKVRLYDRDGERGGRGGQMRQDQSEQHGDAMARRPRRTARQGGRGQGKQTCPSIRWRKQRAEPSPGRGPWPKRTASGGGPLTVKTAQRGRDAFALEARPRTSPHGCRSPPPLREMELEGTWAARLRYWRRTAGDVPCPRLAALETCNPTINCTGFHA
ncbi:hypothetical protein CDD83_2431 [Cordyceps sp. RAO-2017]|nr:hypothetical protein CDD83_2431 [Cordyceps sp. RAO-2017]